MDSKCRIRKWRNPALLAILVWAIKTADGALETSGKANSNNRTVAHIQSVSQTTKGTTALAADTLQVQREAFLSIILSYLTNPEDNPAESAEKGLLGRSADGSTEDQDDPQTPTWSQLADSSIHLRVLRSASGWRNQQLGGSLKPATDRKWNNQWMDGQAEQTGATIEIAQTRTPFTITNGQMIMNELPMVERRSIPQFGGMVILYTRTSPLRLLYYGNWCGSGGMGPTLDEIDQCCMTHDNCYGDVEKLPCKLIFHKPYTVHYAWRWVEDQKQAYCLRTGGRCAEATCECDRKAAACFAKYMINTKLEGNRLRKHRHRTKKPSKVY